MQSAIHSMLPRIDAGFLTDAAWKVIGLIDPFCALNLILDPSLPGVVHRLAVRSNVPRIAFVGRAGLDGDLLEHVHRHHRPKELGHRVVVGVALVKILLLRKE